MPIRKLFSLIEALINQIKSDLPEQNHAKIIERINIRRFAVIMSGHHTAISKNVVKRKANIP